MAQADDRGVSRPWQPFLWLAVASACAHLWCLGSQFYLDDFPQIVDNLRIHTGNFVLGLNTWTDLGYHLQYRLFGTSSVAFHAVNWLLHTAVAWVLFGFGRDFLREKWPPGVALFAALLFAVHPLASEIPNYARTQDLAWVTLFSLLAGWALLRSLREGGWELTPGQDGEIPVFQRTGRWLKWVYCGLAIAGATFSKGPGLIHAMLVVAVVALTNLPQGSGKNLRRWGWIVLGGLAIVATVAWAGGMFTFGFNALQRWQQPRFIGHAFTLSRVFWEFAWRGVVPVALSSDHHIAETLFPAGSSIWALPDRVAVLAMAAMLLLAGGSVWLTWQKSTRLFGSCLLLFIATIFFRMMYLIPEFMPEYRIYPGLPWFCLGAAMLLTGVWNWFFPTVRPRLVAAALLGLFAFLSAQRAFLWHDRERLMADVLDQYPAQGRAIWELHDRDVTAGNWQAVVTRQQQVWPDVRRHFIASLSELGPARELPSGHFSLAEVACGGSYALAICHLKSPAEGLRMIQELEAYMLALRISPSTNPVHWQRLGRDRARVLETSGNFAAALASLQPDDQPTAWPIDYQRIAKKLAAATRE